MAIERLKYKNGIQIESVDSLIKSTRQLLIADKRFALLVPTGYFDLTPEVLRDRGDRHELTVFDTGAGLLRIFSSKSNIHLRTLAGEEMPRQIYLPVDTRTYCLAANVKVGDLRIFEILRFV